MGKKAQANWEKLPAKRPAAHGGSEPSEGVWECILRGPTFGDETSRDWKRRDPTVMLYGREAVEEVIPRFLAILGPDAVCLSEEDFCRTSHCPPGELNEWLATEWIQHHAANIARMRETAGPFPLLLIRGPMKFYILEIWCPKDASTAPPSKGTRESVQ